MVSTTKVPVSDKPKHEVVDIPPKTPVQSTSKSAINKDGDKGNKDVDKGHKDVDKGNKDAHKEFLPEHPEEELDPEMLEPDENYETEKSKINPSKRRSKKKGQGSKCCSSFPCCLGLPLEIGVQLLCVWDLIYSVLSLLLWSSLLGMDLFAHRHSVTNKTEVFFPPTLNLQDPFEITTTTEPPPWTLRTEAPQIPVYDYDVVDVEIASRRYSKIANITQRFHERIEIACGMRYFEMFLFTYESDKTQALWRECLYTAASAEIVYILLSTFLIMSVCCFIEHRGAKLLVMILWWVEWIPIFMQFEALILSQSKRLCILEYALIGFRGQLFLLVFLVVRILLLKPYRLIVHYCYIKQLLVYGYLKDESQHPTEESEYAKDYFSEFYALEAQREGGIEEAYMSTNTSHALAFDSLRHSDVATIQHNVMTAQDDPLSVKNQAIRDMQSGKIQQNSIKSVRHS